MTVAKPGNPHGKENEPLVGTVSFKLDAETKAALKQLEERSGVPNVRGRKSAVIRKLILDAARRQEIKSNRR